MILYVLNLADLISTLLALSLGAVELNPIVDFCISIHPAVFALVKIFPAYWLCRWLEKNGKSYTAVCEVCAAFVVNNIFIILLIGGAFL